MCLNTVSKAVVIRLNIVNKTVDAHNKKVYSNIVHLIQPLCDIFILAYFPLLR